MNCEDLIDNLYQKHDLDQYIDRGKINVHFANWDRKNGTIYYDAKFTKDEFNKRVTGKEDTDGYYAIVLNKRLNHKETLNCLRHELAHAIKYAQLGVTGHDYAWKWWAVKFGLDNPKSSTKRKKVNDYNYEIYCPNGCYTSGRFRKTKKIKNPNNYICKHCGEIIESRKKGGRK